MKRSHKLLISMFAAVLTASSFSQGATAKEATLYDRLGGVHAIAAVVDDFVERLGKDDTVGANAKVMEEIGKVGVPAIKFRVTQFLCHVAGGPQNYTGRNMKTAHAGLGISEAEWQASAGDLKASLDKFKVSDDVQKDLFAAIVSLKKDIVTEGGTHSQAMDEALSDSLYMRLGGVNAVAAVVDEFVNRLAKDPTIGANPHVVKALSSGKISVAGLKYLVTEQLCEAAGGPQKYSGRTMKESHSGLMITEAEWTAGAKILKETLDSFKVPEKEQQEVIGAVLATKKDIIGG